MTVSSLSSSSSSSPSVCNWNAYALTNDRRVSNDVREWPTINGRIHHFVIPGFCFFPLLCWPRLHRCLRTTFALTSPPAPILPTAILPRRQHGLCLLHRTLHLSPLYRGLAGLRYTISSLPSSFSSSSPQLRERPSSQHCRSHYAAIHYNWYYVVRALCTIVTAVGTCWSYHY